MPNPPAGSLPNAYFDAVYRHSDDPWHFESRPYEHTKYTDTLSSLPRPTYAHALEVGCSIGVLTRRLAGRCERLLAVDVAERALAQARARCRDLPHVHFERRRLPEAFPDGRFDLILLSEVGYYWSRVDLERVLALSIESLSPGGHLALVHWTPYVEDYPLTGAAVHAAAHAAAGPNLRHLHGHEAPTYLLDVFERP